MLKPGTRLVREWQGRTYEVLVLDDGLSWHGTSYRSLSALARKITGTAWSGPLFFGLKPNRAATRRSSQPPGPALGNGGIMPQIGQPQERQRALSETERDELERTTRSHSAAHGLVRRASADGEANTAIARRLGVSNPTVCHWRKKWFEQRLVGLYGEARPGRPEDA
jgi:hypothetical protein